MISEEKITIKQLPHDDLINANQNEEAYMWSVHNLNKEERERVLKAWAKKLNHYAE